MYNFLKILLKSGEEMEEFLEYLWLIKWIVKTRFTLLGIVFAYQLIIAIISEISQLNHPSTTANESISKIPHNQWSNII